MRTRDGPPSCLARVDGALQSLLRSSPVPIVEELNVSQRDVRLRRGHCLFPVLSSLPPLPYGRTASADPDRRKAESRRVSDAGIGERVARIASDRLLKGLDSRA